MTFHRKMSILRKTLIFRNIPNTKFRLSILHFFSPEPMLDLYNNSVSITTYSFSSLYKKKHQSFVSTRYITIKASLYFNFLSFFYFLDMNRLLSRRTLTCSKVLLARGSGSGNRKGVIYCFFEVLLAF